MATGNSTLTTPARIQHLSMRILYSRTYYLEALQQGTKNITTRTTLALIQYAGGCNTDARATSRRQYNNRCTNEAGHASLYAPGCCCTCARCMVFCMRVPSSCVVRTLPAAVRMLVFSCACVSYAHWCCVKAGLVSTLTALCA